MLESLREASAVNGESHIPLIGDHQSSDRGGAGVLIGVIIAAVVVAYIPALLGGFVWDDNAYVTENRTLESLSGLWRIWFEFGATPQYYPLVHTTFWIERHLWGLHPFGYHTVNVLLHAFNAVLVFAVLRRLNVRGAWVAAMIFALHPVHVESVAWITERKNVLSGAFYLSAMLAYLRYVELDHAAGEASRRRRCYVAALVLFVCALLSKTVTASLPAAILLILWWKRGRLRGRDLQPLIPMFIAGAILGLVTVWMELYNLRGTGRGAQGPEWDLSWVERCLVAGRAFWFYVGKLVWPTGLTFVYPRWPIDAGVWWQYLYPLAAVVVVGLLWSRRGRIGRAPVAATLFFAGTLTPALGFFNVYPFRYSFVADHFLYLGSLGLIVLFAAAVTALVERMTEHLRSARHGLAAALFTILAVMVWNESHKYEDLEALWLDTLAKNPECWMAHNNLGNVYAREGRLE
ncbi:MAG: O-GlcNAc transferase, partial [Phycisphaerae bacterium]